MKDMDSIYDYTVPVFVKTLGGLKNVLEKAAAHGLDEQALLADRLAPDMFPFVRQVQIACDNTKGATARLAGAENPSFPDEEKTLAELIARVDKTVEYVRSVPKEAFVDAAHRKITLPYFPGKSFAGFDYAREYAIPNFFFHVGMSYALVRKNDVAIGKGDYINGLSFVDAA